MLIKNAKLLTGMLLLLSLSIVSAGSAQANIAKEQLQHHQPEHQENTEKDGLLLSQLAGHDVYDGEEQMSASEYKVGRVVGKSGNILFIVLDDGTYFRAVGSADPGDDVLVMESEGTYSVVEASHPDWISRLTIKEVAALGPLSSRTASIWQELEASSSRSAMTVPPREPAPTYTTPSTTYQEGPPVRALW